MVTRYFVAYDIADPDRLRRVHAIVSAVGVRVQYSVYEALLTLRERTLLEGSLRDVMNLREDQVMFIDLGLGDDGGCPDIETIGRVWQPQRRAAVIM